MARPEHSQPTDKSLDKIVVEKVHVENELCDRSSHMAGNEYERERVGD